MFLNYLKSLRPYFWLPALIPAFTGALLSSNYSLSFYEIIILFFVFGPGIPGAAEAINDYFDFNIDKLENRNTVLNIPSSGGSGILQSGLIKKDVLFKLSILLFSFSFILSLFTNILFVIFIVLGIVGAVIYSAPPLRLKNRSLWGCFIQAFCYGIVTFSAGWFLTSPSFSFIPIVIGTIIGIALIGYGSVADLADYDADKLNNILTLPVRYGKTKSKIFYISTLIISYLSVFLLQKSGFISINNINFYIVLIVLTFIISTLLLLNDTRKSYSIIHFVGVIIESIFPLLFLT